MFDKVEFSDLYKFKTSIGLLIIGLGMILPWLFLKQEGELLIGYKEYYNLIPESKLLLDKKLSLATQIIQIIPLLSSILIISGLILTIIGYCKWNTKQQIVDSTERINFDNLKAGVQSQSAQEIIDRATHDVEEEKKYQSDQELQNETMQEPTSETQKQQNTENVAEVEKTESTLSENLISMENLFLEKIISYNSFNYFIKSNVKIANQYEVDFLLNAYNTKKFKDIIIEIKYLQSKLTMQLVRTSFNKGLHATALYSSATKKNCQFILIIVYRNDIADEQEIERFLAAIAEYTLEINSNTHQIYVMSDKQVSQFNINGIIK